MSTDGKPTARPARREWKIAAGVGLAIVVGICVVIAVANWKGPPQPQGWDGAAAAAANLREYVRVQAMYKKAKYGGKDEYAHPLAQLYSTQDAAGKPVRIALIDERFSEAWGPEGRARYGHLFQEVQTIAGRPIDWEKEFALCATPAAPDARQARLDEWPHRAAPWLALPLQPTRPAPSLPDPRDGTALRDRLRKAVASG